MQELDPDEEEAPEVPGYYISKSRKVTDFLIGFLGCIIVAISVYYWDLNSSPRGDLPGLSATLNSLSVTFLVALLILVISHVLKRKFIAIGVFATLIIPAIAFGSCFLAR